MILPDTELLGEKNNIQIYRSFDGIRILSKKFLVKLYLLYLDIL